MKSIVVYLTIVFSFILTINLVLWSAPEKKQSPVNPDHKTEMMDDIKQPDLLEKESNDFIFDINHILDIEITMDPEEWEKLSNQSREFNSLVDNCMKGPIPNPYNDFPAIVTIDGKKIGTVGLRKKGFLGSVVKTRPSLKLKFNKYDDELRYLGIKSLTLNNNRQDRSLIKQYLGYSFFRKAGMASPRCNFAHVRVNGKDLGIYSNVENIKKPFLKKNFGNSKGALFEGQTSDFTTDELITFENKKNKNGNDLSKLKPLVSALNSTDSNWLELVRKLVDLDSFINYWVIEAIIAHWDGYSNNKNNFYIYENVDSQKFYFIPWGLDVTFLNDPFSHGKRPRSLSANGILSYRLYQLPEFQTKYKNRMQYILDTFWKENELLDLISDLMEKLSPYADNDAVEKLKNFVKGTRSAIDKELNAWPIQWNRTDKKYCYKKGLMASGSFMTQWNTSGGEVNSDHSNGDMKFKIGSESYSFTKLSVESGVSELLTVIKQPSVTLSEKSIGGQGKKFTMKLYIEENLFKSGKTIDFHAMATCGILYCNRRPIAILTEGKLTIKEAGTANGSPVSGSFSGRLYYFPHYSPP